MLRPWLLAVALLGCVRSNATTCGDLLCPVGDACFNDRCIDGQIVSACAGHADGDACSLGEGGDGTCQMRLCIVGHCGDGVLNGVEACDGLDLDGQTCADFGGNGGTLRCTPDCTFDKTGCSAFCGDNHVDPGEDCDGADFNHKSCVDYGFYGGALACTNECQINLGACSGRCGDGQLQGLEVCDGANLGGQTCLTLGYKGPVVPLTCSATCTYNPTSCTCGGVLCPNTAPTCVDDGGGVFSCM